MANQLSLRLLEVEDIDLILKYWKGASPEYLRGMGADINKFPDWDDFYQMLEKQSSLPYSEKKSLALIWLQGKEAIGHSNVNKIEYGKQAFMHLHLWNTSQRKQGMGARLVSKSLPHYFENLELETLYCEPYAYNEAPNWTLQKVGFVFIKKHRCVPGSLNFEQDVNRWQMNRSRYMELFKK